MTEPDRPDSARPHVPAHEAPGVATPHPEHRPAHLRITDEDSADGTVRGRSGPEPHKWWTLVAVCLGTFMLLLDVTIVNVALPDIQAALGTSFSGLQWVVDAYALTLAALLLTSGSLADLFGRRRLYVIGLVLFTAASLLCGLAGTSLLLQLSRGLQGIGGAIMFAVSLALLADAFRGKDRGVAFGVWGAITGLAVAIGPLLGGALTSGLSWRWIFLVNLPIGAFAVVICLLRVAESRAQNARRPDWLGFVVFTLALSSLVYGLIESNQRTFGSGLVIGCLVAAGVLLLLFVLVELRSRSPMFDLSLFRLPTFSGGAVAAFGLSASIFALLLYLVLYIQDVLGFNAFQTGLRLLVLSGGIIATSAVAGRLTSHVPVRFLIGPGLLLVGVGLLLMRGLDANSTWTHLIPGLIVAGAGVGMVNPPLASTAVGVVDAHRAGMASGINSTFRQVGIATGIALLGTLFTGQVTAAVRSATAGVPALADQGDRIATAIGSGGVAQLIAGLPADLRQQVGALSRTAFTSGLDRIMLVAAIIVLVSAVVAFFAIRSKDFAQQSAR
ncbi:drug resistance transporter, EmrB/QacA subfamily [Nakamurella panacisegetis]|uniref:Drug resistance transporter, EmrB/QacA subfamily n=1 Tax=Nakamurella panacisegetis TaxID=1090615 RepID=A0A1H0N590_9ACTN|nr:MFS transporter [Nakamurella panacisegetis]SDO87802.1 drug resistance transporter, EmrB/QacA subfamily [Nakamurella panacisegetis]